MAWRTTTRCLFLGLCLVIGKPTFADIDANAVRKSIERAIQFLKREQNPNGSWVPYADSRGGVTGLCTLALLEAGVPPNDPAVRRGLAYLRAVPPKKTYAVALQTMALCRGGDPADLGLIRRNARWLSERQIRGGAKNGAWGYSTGGGDSSNSQFAVLALHEAALAGADIDTEVWEATLDYWKRGQNESGSWSYAPHPNRQGAGRGSMTCAGIASVVIAQFHLQQADATIKGRKCVCERQADDRIVRRGLRWLGNHFAVSFHPAEDFSGDQFHFYYLYGVERVGRMTAQRFFYRDIERQGRPARRYDWYRQGADYLVGAQQPEGSWSGMLSKPVESSFALLFLSKGRRPVLVSKLQRRGKDWQRLRHDIANLTRYTEQQWKIPVTWQVVDARTARGEDYLQSPVLFLSGEDAFNFGPEQIKALRDYVEQGGFIFADACCGGGDFDASFRELMEAVFPEPELRLRPLEPEHPIWSVEETPDPRFVNPDGHWLEGIDFGCRTSVVYSPNNLSCYWELMQADQTDRFVKLVQDEIEACRAVGINVLAYATNRELKDKDSVQREILASDDTQQTTRGHFAIAKLEHAGGCDAAPRALANLMKSLTAELEMRTIATPQLLSVTDEKIFDYHLLYLHGRYDFRFSAQELEQLRSFVERGGMIVADSICGSEAFTTAARRELGRLYPNREFARIPATDPILTPAYGGADVRRVSRRETFRAEQGGRLEVRNRQGPPILEALEYDGRYAVIFSPLDISCALENQAAPQCYGYTNDDATRIAINVVLYSLHE
ncbi:MAG: DUF4159 domain-containing protein [Planctomycetota bacterium]|nr:MAG: DUF4159 domain-containing protein [Planctomycetota bacterium]REJ89995.1 MAG: DUF4159 domain-containing protein [Planctomycetota bacterium]